MAQDNSNYEIVQITEANWAIQYADGRLVTGFSTRQAAIDGASTALEETPAAPPSNSPPKNLDEALVSAQSARDNYRSFVGENPTASEESKDALIAAIAAADAYVSEYQNQLELARRNSNEKTSLVSLNFENQLANANERRIETAAYAVSLRTDPDATQQEIWDADDEAFAAEVYYESLLRELQTEIDNAFELSAATSSLFSGGSRTYVNFGGQVVSSDTDISSSSDSNFDIIRNTLSNDFGSITRTGLMDNSVTSGYGFTQYSGNTVYDTSVGVTSVASSADQRIKLSPKPSIRSGMLTGVLAPLTETGGLVFPYTPTVSMQASTNYQTLETTHANQDYHIYKNTPSIDITIQGTFTAQNETEAKYLLASIHFLRVLTKMHFGENDSNKGLPPPQVFLDGYGTHMFNGLSVIVKNYEVQLPDNVDYVTVSSAGGVSKVPTVTTLSVLVTVQQTPAKARSFNWDSFASGELMQQKGWL